MFDNIPHEMRAFKQWVCWRETVLENGEKTKLPLDPKTGRLASVTDPSTWADFDTAVAAAPYCNGIGFVLTSKDPYAIADLDDPYAVRADGTPKHKNAAEYAALQQQIVSRFDTYSEISPSGRGLHIIAKGAIPKGRRRYSCEMYSSERYITMTGNVYNPTPIKAQQDLITSLYEHMGGEAKVYTFQGTFEDKEPDNTILDRAAGAVNGQKFIDLWQGDWLKHYPSQSEADFALVDILSYYTTSRFQLIRLFRQSSLGQRDKAIRDSYVSGMIDKSFDRHLPPIDIEGMRERLEDQMQNPVAGATDDGASVQEAEESTACLSNVSQDPNESNPYLRPVPGLVGDIAYFIYRQSPRPVPEIALAAAIALIAGIAGRSYNVNGTGLNQYILLLAPTGRGKEAITSGITTLMNTVTDIGDGKGGCPGAKEFLGPERIASGQALVKHLDKVSRSFVTIQGEFDATLKSFTARNANAGLIALRQTLLSMYSRSGRGQAVQPTIYSDKDKNTHAITSPAITLIGEGTPERFYSLLDETLVSDGLLPRFTIIEYNGERPPLNEHAPYVTPPDDIVKRLAQLAGYSLMLNQNNTIVDVQFDGEGKALLDAFNVEADAYINQAQNETIAELWNRAHLKALKLAATIAVGCNMQVPTISREIADYAIACVRRDTSRMVVKFELGDVGEGESKQVSEIRKLLRKYFEMPSDKARSYKIPEAMHRDKIVSRRYLQSRTANLASFKNDRFGASKALDNIIRSLIDIGVMVEVGRADLAKYGNFSGRHYIVTDGSWLYEGK